MSAHFGEGEIHACITVRVIHMDPASCHKPHVVGKGVDRQSPTILHREAEASIQTSVRNRN